MTMTRENIKVEVALPSFVDSGGAQAECSGPRVAVTDFISATRGLKVTHVLNTRHIVKGRGAPYSNPDMFEAIVK